MPITYKYRPGRGPITLGPNNKEIEIFERDIKLLSQDRIYVPTPKQLNDPTESLVDDSALNTILDFLKQLSKSETSIKRLKDSYVELKKTIETNGVYSLSKTPISELMWAYYANGHNGYAIIFDTDVLYKSLNGGTRFANIHAFDVDYVSSIPKINASLFYDKSTTDFLRRFIGCKSKSWEHEQEYRLIFDKGGEIKHIDYRAIKGFVFGSLMPQTDIEYIMNLFKGRHLVYYKIKLNPKKYQLYTDELEDLYKDAPNYHPNNVTYDFDALIEDAKFYDDIILSYKEQAREALEIVACEPFVIDITSLTILKDLDYPGSLVITICTNYNNPSVIQQVKIFRFSIQHDGRLLQIE